MEKLFWINSIKNKYNLKKKLIKTAEDSKLIIKFMIKKILVEKSQFFSWKTFLHKKL